MKVKEEIMKRLNEISSMMRMKDNIVFNERDACGFEISELLKNLSGRGVKEVKLEKDEEGLKLFFVLDNNVWLSDEDLMKVINKNKRIVICRLFDVLKRGVEQVRLLREKLIEELENSALFFETASYAIKEKFEDKEV